MICSGHANNNPNNTLNETRSEHDNLLGTRKQSKPYMEQYMKQSIAERRTESENKKLTQNIKYLGGQVA